MLVRLNHVASFIVNAHHGISASLLKGLESAGALNPADFIVSVLIRASVHFRVKRRRLPALDALEEQRTLAIGL